MKHTVHQKWQIKDEMIFEIFSLQFFSLHMHITEIKDYLTEIKDYLSEIKDYLLEIKDYLSVVFQLSCRGTPLKGNTV